MKVSELSKRVKVQEDVDKLRMAYERMSTRKLGVWRRSVRNLGMQC